MFETAIRQLRMSLSMVQGKQIDTRNIERLIHDAIKTLQEFGTPGDDAETLLEGPFVDPASRQAFQNHLLQGTARYLARFSPYYQQLFAAHAIDPEKLTVQNMSSVPLTTKQEVREQPQQFITANSRPCTATPSTGTTGRPIEIWLSRYEIELWSALAALSGLLRDEIRPEDCFQVNVSSRATGAVQQNLATCRLVGARTRALGLVPPDESLDSLLDQKNTPTLLIIYPSYLAELVHAARRRGLGPDDFQLRRIVCGGEILSEALKHAVQETFGSEVSEGFGMTEVLPVSGRVCNQGHLHYDLSMGLIEVVDLQTHQPVAPGELGTVVITPYYPYRVCMPVFRHDTCDIVRRLPDEPLTCNLAAIPATSRIQGKAEHLLYSDGRVITPRDLIEVIEALPSQPWPARYQVSRRNGHIELLLQRQTLRDISVEEVEHRFRMVGIELQVTTSGASCEQPLRPLRTDLLETTFATRRM